MQTHTLGNHFVLDDIESMPFLPVSGCVGDGVFVTFVLGLFLAGPAAGPAAGLDGGGGRLGGAPGRGGLGF